MDIVEVFKCDNIDNVDGRGSPIILLPIPINKEMTCMDS